jgi:hypothetical protein
VVLTTSDHKNYHFPKHFTRHSSWTDPSIRYKLWKRDMRFGMWSAKCLERSRSLTSVARELARYRSHLAVLQEVRWAKGGTV